MHFNARAKVWYRSTQNELLQPQNNELHQSKKEIEIKLNKGF